MANEPNTECRKVLIVDDETDIARGVSQWLAAAGFETLLASTADAGISVAIEQHPTAIILDVLMPRKDGMEALRELRNRQDTVDIPVVMLSASLRDQQRALDAGARFFVHKPYDGKKLVATVEAAIRQSKSHANWSDTAPGRPMHHEEIDSDRR